MPLSIVQRAIVAHVQDNPGCTKGDAARATAVHQGPSVVRERMRTVGLLIERGYLVDREARRKSPLPLARLHVTARGRRALEAGE